MTRFRFVPVAVLIVAFALGACSSDDSDSATSTPKGDCPTAPVPVVVSVDQWGDIVEQLAGDCGDVTTVFKSSSADPHDYEPTPGDIAKFTGSKLVVVNGLDYDPWANKAVDALDEQPTLVDGGEVVGLQEGDNPHIWYGPQFVRDVSDAVTEALKKIQPEAAEYFDGQATKWDAALEPYDAEIARIEAVAPGKTYGATEGIFSYMAEAVGLDNLTPLGYRTATDNESDPAPGDVNEFEQALADGTISVLIYNTQTEGAIPEQVRAQAEQNNVPVVDVTESVPPGIDSFVEWQVGQLKDLATALEA